MPPQSSGGLGFRVNGPHRLANITDDDGVVCAWFRSPIARHERPCGRQGNKIEYRRFANAIICMCSCNGGENIQKKSSLYHNNTNNDEDNT